MRDVFVVDSVAVRLAPNGRVVVDWDVPLQDAGGAHEEFASIENAIEEFRKRAEWDVLEALVSAKTGGPGYVYGSWK